MIKIIKNNLYKSKAAVIIQKQFEAQINLGCDTGLYGVEPSNAATKIVQEAWNSNELMLSGAFGTRPHQLMIAMFALSFFVAKRYERDGDAVNSDRLLLTCTNFIGVISDEILFNGRLYGFGVTDDVVRERAIALITPFVKATNSRPLANEISEATPLPHSTIDWDMWYFMYVEAAIKGSDEAGGRGLSINSDGLCLIDLMDHEPLKNAWTNKIDAVELGYQFGITFNISQFSENL
ncbi:hypothetical protein VIN01S_22060 [Vibrio inusitatus NBRC 102082]|uniref:Uncharacterized protein n=1 Tax=Vibrio inusitatus NBRC 102082 TaxID=1219070 RepID=A0A4Y3HXH5_9VIBR|nr:hypothetical protein [Vibrio inusitatus]GEA51402.1 hypothetical protein VIN01S_22060 [Vibrio inusitatus NBRC 102082]